MSNDADLMQVRTILLERRRLLDEAVMSLDRILGAHPPPPAPAIAPTDGFTDGFIVPPAPPPRQAKIVRMPRAARAGMVDRLRHWIAEQQSDFGIDEAAVALRAETKKVSDCLSNLAYRYPRLLQRVGRGRYRGRKAGPAKPKAERAAKSRKVGGPASLAIEEVVTWLGHKTEPVDAAMCAAAFGCEWKTAHNWLTRLVQKGLARKAGKGKFVQASPAKVPAKPAEPEPRPEPPAPAPVTQQRLGHMTPVTKQVEAVLLAIDGVTDWFTVPQLENWMRKKYPQFIDAPGQASNLRVRLIDMANNGTLERRGFGAGAHYRRTPRAAKTEPELKISVPRDADAGNY